VLYNKTKTVLVKFPAGKTGGFTIPSGITEIEARAFYRSPELTRVTIPKSVKKIGQEAFYGCTKLTRVTFAAGSNIENLAFGTFGGIPGYYNNVLTDDSLAYYYNIEQLAQSWDPEHHNPAGTYTRAIGSGTWTKQAIADNIFYSIDEVRAFLAEKPANTPYDPYYIELNINSLSDHSYTTGSLGNVLRNNPGKCVNLDLSDSTFTIIGDGAFSGCTGLTSVTIPASVTIIGDGAFSGCTGLTSITIPNSVTSIGEWAFSDCTGLTSVTIPGSVTSIEESAFYLCGSLTSVTFTTGSNITDANFKNGAFPEGYNGYGGDSLKNAYLAANPKAGTYIRAAGGSVWTKQP